MKQKILSILTIAAASAGLMEATAATASTNAVNVNELAQYVYPANRAASASLSFSADGLTYFKIGDTGKTIDRYDVATGKFVETVLDVTKTRGDKRLESIASYSLSPDGSKMLVYESATPIYRYSIWASYYVYDLKRNTLKPLSTEHPQQQSPVFSPDARMVAFMAPDNNIYLSKLDFETEVPVTTDGEVNAVINGVPDWTYQEEFTTYRSMEWAPDNSALSYLKYDERDVPEFNFMLYQGACDPKDQYALHPGVFSYKYPVAGEKNSHVTLHSYDVDTRKTKDIDLPGNDIEYLARIHYGPTADVLLVTTLNRNQNRMEIFSVNPRSTVSRSIYVDQSNAWITPQCYENISYGANDFVIFSDRTGYSHLYRYNYNGQKLAQLTSGDFDVTAYYGTAADGTYYYQSTNGTPINRVITKVNSKGVRTNITPTEGWASATFAAPMNYYVLSYSNATTPTVYTLMNSAKERAVRTLEDNAAYAARFASAPHKEFFTMQANGQTFNGWMIKPTNFDASKKYPAIIYQYSGPGSQEVANRWGMDWMQYFATQGYVIACIDGRGTGARGREFEQIVYKNLGHYETIDQNSLLTYLQQQPWIDADHIGIHGWSYGGYETLMAATSKAPYAAAVAVAPVTSWRYYDTIYAERYMSTPQQNADGYNSSAPVERTAQLSCPLLIMSGSADDNVHMSNTMEFMARLENNNKWADMLIFPNMNHSINGCNTRALVYSRMLHFFNSNLR